MRITLLLTIAFSLCSCAVTQDQNTPVSQTLEKDPGTNQEFWLYVPSTYRHNKCMPVIISCHGTPPYDIADHHIREWKSLGEKHGCIIIAPRMNATDGILGDGPIVGMKANERAILSILSLLGYRYNIDRANIMITGFSGGGFPTYWVGMRRWDVFSAIVARNCNFSKSNLDTWFSRENLPSQQPPSIMIYYGEHDPGTIIAQSKKAITYFREIKLLTETKIIPGAGHERRPEVAMEFFQKNLRKSRPSFSSDQKK